MTRPEVRAEQRWQARPVLAAALRAVLLAVPLLASAGCALLVVRTLPPGAATRWWGLVLVLVTSVTVAFAVERAARRLLPLAVLLKLSLLFPDRAPSRLRLSRDAGRRRPRSTQVVVDGDRPTTVSQLVLDLVADLGAHDRRTRGHSERVRVLTDVLAEELKLDEHARDRLRWSALLHDVGKVRVSATILNKPSRLDAREFDRIKLHPQAGAELTAPLLPWLGEWGEGIVDHHERYDGGGYPAGKAGEQISVAGRVLAVVDAFETMTAARPYKKAMATRAAREELARCAGTHFDPVYVRAFLAVSLPRVLWAMGPLSFLLQLPFLPSIAQAGARTGAISTQAATAAAGAAGAAVLATGSLVAVGDAAGVLDVGSLRPPSSAQQAGGDRPEPVLVPAERPQAPAVAGPAPRPTPVAPVPRPTVEQAPPPTTEPDPPAPRPAGAGAEPPVAADRELPAGQDPAEPAPAEPDPAPEPAPAPSPSPEPAPADAGPARPEPGAPSPADPAPAEPGPAEPTPPAARPAPTTAEPAPTGSPPAEPPADAADDEQPEVGRTGAVILGGPPSPTTDRSAVFTLAEVAGVQWECKVPRNATGRTSRWQPCAGTFTLELLREGENVLRARDAATGQELDSWTWTITSGEVAARPVLALPHDTPAVPGPGPALPLMALLTTLALPGATLVRRLRAGRP